MFLLTQNIVITFIFLSQRTTVYESVNYPGYYIRHSSYRLRIDREDNSKLLHKDASFSKTKGKNLDSCSYNLILILFV